MLPSWERGGVVVSTLDFRSEGPWLDAQSLPLCCFLRQETLPPHCLSPPRYTKWVPATYCWGVTLRWTSIPSRGEQQYSQMLQATATGLSSGRVGFLGSCATLPLYVVMIILRTSKKTLLTYCKPSLSFFLIALVLSEY